jgi:WXXGXW repeat (2 copies)
MKTQHWWNGLAVLPLLLALAGPLEAGARVLIRVAPPPLRHEAVVARPGPAYVWTPGFWRWSATRYVWVDGVWRLPPRPRAVWVAGHYRHVRGGWIWIDGHWKGKRR